MRAPTTETRFPWALLAAAGLGTFAVTSGGTTRAPFLIDMAADLEVGLPMVANLFGLTSVAWGITSFVAGTGSDRWGRRPFLIGGLVALALALVGVARGEEILTVIVWVAIAGGCSGCFTGVSLAEVSLRVADGQRGRAISWVMSGQSLTLLVGVPLAAWIGAGIGWRGVHLCVAALALVAALAMFLTTRPSATSTAAADLHAARRPSLKLALTGPVIRLLASVVAERICFGLAAVYYATFLQTVHALSLQALAPPLVVFALGNILGTLQGGRLADRLANRRLTFALAMIVSAAVAMALFAWAPSLAVTVPLAFAYAFFNALSRPSLMALLTAVPAEVRGTVMGLNSTAASLGWLGAAALGGWMLTTIGFAGFGPLIAVMAVAAAALSISGPGKIQER
jgi:DHA1 family inner membrane transport protein